MAIEAPVKKTPRELLRAQYRENLKLKAQEIPSGPLEGKRVVLWDDVEWALGQSFPPASDHGAEVTTPARVVVYAVCPRCNLTAPVAIEVTPELRVDTTSGHLHVKAKAKPATHVCGQLMVDMREDGQGSFELEDIIGYDGEPLALGEYVRVAYKTRDETSLIGPIIGFRNGEIEVVDPTDSEHRVWLDPLDADRLTGEQADDVRGWPECPEETCPLLRDHKGGHIALDRAVDEDLADDDSDAPVVDDVEADVQVPTKTTSVADAPSTPDAPAEDDAA